MTKRLALFNRLLFGILGLVLIALGLWAIFDAAGVSVAQELTSHLDRAFFASITETSWYKYAAVALSLAMFIAGVTLITANLRQQKIAKVDLPSSDGTGKITAHLPSIAAAIADYLLEHDGVDKVSTRIARERGRSTATFTVEVNPTVGLEAPIRLLEAVEADFRDAIEGIDLDTVYKLHCSEVPKV